MTASPWGYGASDQATLSYPGQVGTMLGAGYTVQNFGVNGTDVLKNGDNPYWKYDAFAKAKALNPNVVIIGLGTNDIGSGSIAHLSEFEGDYESMVNVFKGLPSHPKVFAMYPLGSRTTTRATDTSTRASTWSGR